MNRNSIEFSKPGDLGLKGYLGLKRRNFSADCEELFQRATVA
jgi:hypothetical protein